MLSCKYSSKIIIIKKSRPRVTSSPAEQNKTAAGEKAQNSLSSVGSAAACEGLREALGVQMEAAWEPRNRTAEG